MFLSLYFDNSPIYNEGLSAFNTMNSKLPSISVVTNTYNPDPVIFEEVLKALKKQTYPKKLVEHIVIDGGSTNNTVKLAKAYKCRVVVRADLKEQEQMRSSMGFKMAKGKLIVVIQSDNIVISKDWLTKMVQPFVENKKVFCAFSEKNGYRKKMPLLTRYCALFGVNDPTIYYLHKTEKIRMDETKYNKGKILEEHKNYYIVKFNKNNLPPIGDNGHMFLKSAIRKAAQNTRDYMHTDAFSVLLSLGYDTYGVVKNSIIHVQKPDIVKSVNRRVELKEKFYDKYRGKRKYLVYDPNSTQDRINLIKYIIFTFTIVVPLFASIRGYTRIRDVAWFLHPVICILMVTAFGLSEVKMFFKRLSF